MKKRYILGITAEIFSLIIFRSIPANGIVIKELPLGTIWLLLGMLALPYLCLLYMLSKDTDVKAQTQKFAKVLFWHGLIVLLIIYVGTGLASTFLTPA